MQSALTESALIAFEQSLKQAEKSEATVEKYLRDIRVFSHFLSQEPILSQETLLRYKQWLTIRYAVSSVNSMLTALNLYLKFSGRTERLKLLKTQRPIFCPKETELSKMDYSAMIQEARRQKKDRLVVLIETMGATGIRVSELSFITVEAVRKGVAHVNCKGKNRVILLPGKLCQLLSRYANEHHIVSGSILITRGGKPLDRSNVWKEMKRLGIQAKVCKKKVFPHNLRHLFARTFYQKQKDIARLADLLGHASIDTTRLYIITSGEEQERQIDALGLVLS